MAQRVTLAVPGPNGVDVNVGTTLNPLFISGGSSTTPDIVGGEYNSTLPTLATGQTDALQLGARGSLHVELFAVDSSNSPVTVNSPADGSGNTTVAALKVHSYGFQFNGTTWDRARGDTNGAFIVAKGSATMATNQVSVATTSTLIVAARVGRSSVTITNLGATDIFIGNTGVTLTTGTLLVGTKGAAITIPTSAAIYGIASVAQSVSFIENY